MHPRRSASLSILCETSTQLAGPYIVRVIHLVIGATRREDQMTGDVPSDLQAFGVGRSFPRAV